MKIVLIGKTREMSDFYDFLQRCGMMGIMKLAEQKYQIKADDCIVFDQEADEKEIEALYQMKLEGQQPLKIWSLGALYGELEKFGYSQDDESIEDIGQILNFLFTGKKLPYDVINN